MREPDRFRHCIECRRAGFLVAAIQPTWRLPVKMREYSPSATPAGNRMQTTSINVDIPYTLDTGEKLVNETFGPNNIHRRHIGTMDPHAMQIENGRSLARDFSLDKNGFMFVEHETAVTDFFDQANLPAAYY